MCASMHGIKQKCSDAVDEFIYLFKPNGIYSSYNTYAVNDNIIIYKFTHKAVQRVAGHHQGACSV